MWSAHVSASIQKTWRWFLLPWLCLWHVRLSGANGVYNQYCKLRENEPGWVIMPQQLSNPTRWLPTWQTEFALHVQINTPHARSAGKHLEIKHRSKHWMISLTANSAKDDVVPIVSSHWTRLWPDWRCYILLLEVLCDIFVTSPEVGRGFRNEWCITEPVQLAIRSQMSVTCKQICREACLKQDSNLNAWNRIYLKLGLQVSTVVFVYCPCCTIRLRLWEAI